MKRNQLCFYCLLTLLVAGCHKDDNTVSYRIKQIIHKGGGDSDTSYYTYDAQGRVIHDQNTLGVADFTFSGGTFISNRYTSPAYSTGTIVAGRMATWHVDSSDYYNPASDETYIYDSIGELIATHGYEEATYYWSNGNLDSTSWKESYTYTSYTEYRDRAFTDQYLYNNILFGGGLLGKSNKNLISSYTYVNYQNIPYTISYSYTFDNKGRVATMTIGDQHGTYHVYTYIYE